MNYFFSFFLIAFFFQGQLKAQNKPLAELTQDFPGANHQKKIKILEEIAYFNAFYQPSESLLFTQSTLSELEDAKLLKGKAWAWTTIGTVHLVKGQFPQSIDYLQKAQNLFVQLKEKKGIGRTYVLIGLFHMRQKNYEKAIDNLNKGLEIQKKMGSNGEVQRTLNNLGTVYLYQEKYASALPYFKQAEELLQNDKVEHINAVVYNNLGISYVGLNKHQEGLDYLFQANKIFSDLGLTKRVGENTFWIADSYQKMGNDQKAEAFALLAADKAKKSKDLFYQKQSYEVLVKVYRKNKDYEKAMIYQDMYIKANDSLFTKDKIEAITNLENQAELEKKDIIIAQQQQTNESLALRNYLILVGLILVLILSYFLYQSRQKTRNINKTLSKQNRQIQIQKDEIKQQAEQLTEINSTKDKLFAIVGHDLRSPIQVLSSWMALLENQTISPEEFLEYSDELKKRVDNVQFVLQNLLLWANNQMQGLVTKPEILSLKDLIDEHFALTSSLAQSKQIQLVNEISADKQAWADKDQVNIVLRNLIHNALKFTPDQGIISAHSQIEQNYLRVAIRDSGVGIHPEDQIKLFKKQQYFSSQGSRGEKGTGLGLLLSLEMVEKNKGKLWAESRPDVGSTFYFTLPLPQN